MTTTRTTHSVLAISLITLSILREHKIPFTLRALETSTAYCPCNPNNSYYETPEPVQFKPLSTYAKET